MLGPGAASAEPYGCASLTDKNLKLSACITLEAPFGPATEAGFKVSGTNVNLTFETVVENAAYSGQDPWSTGEVMWLEAKIGDSPWHHWTAADGWIGGGGDGQDPPGTVVDEFAKGARFASTHFNHGASILVQVKAGFTLYDQQMGGMGVIVEASISVDAYNEVLSWGTDEDLGPNGFFRPNPEPLLSPPLVAREAFALLYPDEYVGLKHLKYPASTAGDAVKELQEDELEAEMDKATLYVTVTHGAGNPEVGNIGLRSSYDDGNAANGDDELTWAEIAGYVSRVHTPPTTQTVPLPNMSLVWACANHSGLDAAASAFGMVGRPNAAHAGFEQSVAARLFNMGRQSLARHTEAVLNELRRGKRLKDAVETANNDWPPQAYPISDPPTSIEMKIRGDAWSRLVNVYVSEAEGETLFVELKDSWYWFKP